MSAEAVPGAFLMSISLVPRYHGSHSSEKVRQYEAWGFGLHTVNPEIGTAGVILVAPVQQLEVVSLRVECLSK